MEKAASTVKPLFSADDGWRQSSSVREISLRPEQNELSAGIDLGAHRNPSVPLQGCEIVASVRERMLKIFSHTSRTVTSENHADLLLLTDKDSFSLKPLTMKHTWNIISGVHI